MKVILFTPRMYSLTEMLKDGFEANGWEVKIADYRDMLPKCYSDFYERTVGLPNRLTKYWKPKYYSEINKKYLDYFNIENPDMVLIYNNQFFFPETLKKMRRNCKIVFYLGDNPLWSRTFDYNLQILQYSDYTISPDSYWTKELSSMGIPNIINDFIGYSNKVFFIASKIPDQIYSKYESDVIFIGSNYVDASGYKRALFMSKFEGFKFKIFGDRSWNRWLQYFPELLKNYHLINSRITNSELNYAINSAKIYVIDQNTGIINGIHNRVFEVIGAGCLPVVEWRKDIDRYFYGEIPTIKNYEESSEVINKYLNDETLRMKTIEILKKIVDDNYRPDLFVKRVVQKTTE
jgi:hypothetical protein